MTHNADAAQASFLSSLINPGVETFEGIADATTLPFGIVFGNGVTATLSGTANVQSLSDGTATGDGRYGVTGDIDSGERYLETTDGFTVSFSSPVSAFGFYGVDIGDIGGQLTVTTAGDLNQVFNIPHSSGGGAVLFWGLIDPAATFTSVVFGNTAPGADFFGFDDFTVGTAQQVNVPVPEPSTLFLFGIGVAALGARRRFHRI